MLVLRKRDLLSYLANTDTAHAHDVARAFGVPYAVAAMALLRLVRQGLATRERAAKQGVYRYRLSERGRSRLQYLDRRASAENADNPVEPARRPVSKQ